ncbi:glycerol-3-phosphate dehydrogenase/oxidase [Streptococcus sp. X16XC17]|uniref:FAD-dependent oxidoreductase n=1 Tax=unclassified Streptococcus TaxID=2608887 RepID=UPI00066FEAF5|nr:MULTISPECIES: FAD-dependent oxidoreductase [unclassified Streptococcus]TCD46615.1 glycerol-3-phosphate dehydrogenase/oxidase [Streptococcus sp. X16XC17]
MEFSTKTRRLSLQKMQERTLDLLIIGGGITGAGVALQAAASGLDTGLIDTQDFAEGTSSRSTKLVHGGLRYLKQFDVEVVADTVSERAVVQRIAPHIPKPDPMILPVYDEPGSTFSMFRLKVAMDLYDLLANVSNTPFANKVLSKEEILKRLPDLQEEGLVGGGVYLDFRNNDARLVIENIKRANQDGALIASHVKAAGFLYDENGKVTGVTARDLSTDQVLEMKARLVINTTGPWSDTVCNLEKDANFHTMRPTNGGNSGKMSDDSFNHLISTVQSYLEHDKDRKDVEEAATHLEGSLSEKTLDPSAVSRGSSLERDENGLITLSGGKITDYRKMAEGAMDMILQILRDEFGRKFKLIHSKTYTVSGGDLNSANVDQEIEAYAQLGLVKGLSLEESRYLANLYGSNVPTVYNLADELQAASGLSLADTLSLHYAMRYEMALTPVDFFLRRTNYMLFKREQLDDMVEPVLHEMAVYYDWSEEEKESMRSHLQETLAENDLKDIK